MILLSAVAFIMSIPITIKGNTPRISQIGIETPKILRFLRGADAAVSLQFDDSMTSQLANALPLLNARGIRATFFVITDSWQYKTHRQEWEVDVPKDGHELGDHTSHHTGAKTIEELTKEIGDCADQLIKVVGPKPRLMSFAIPGGVPWNFSQAQLDPILQKYNLVLADHRNFFDEQKTDPISFVQKAIDTHSWTNVAMHGTGGEWLSTSIPNLTRLLDFINVRRPALWVAPQIEVFKYVQERDAAEVPLLTVKDADTFSIDLRCDPSKLSTFGLPVSALYDQPLTIEVRVPDTWQSFRVTQGKNSHRYVVGPTHVARFEVLPNSASAVVSHQIG